MRELATLAREAQATTLADHLLTLGIATRLDKESQGWVVWVRDEDRMERARQELELYLREPEHPRYRDTERAAEQVRKQEEAAEREYRKRYVDAKTLWGRPTPRRCLITLGLIVISVAVTILTDFGKKHESPIREWLTFSRYTIEGGGVRVSRDPLHTIKSLELWRLITPIFLHLNWLHIIFNMLMLYDFGGRVETHRGWWRFLILVLVSAALSNLAQNLVSRPFLGGGMSGVIYALFGYLWMKTRYDPTPGMFLPRDTVIMGLVWLVLCLTGYVGNIANTAHFVGLGVGIVAGGARPMLRTLRRRLIR